MSAPEARALIKQRAAFDILDVYTDGEPDIRKIIELEAGWLIKSIAFDDAGKVQKVTLHNDDCGYVYLITAPNGMVKIGRSKDLQKRFNAINLSSPIDLELTHSRFVPKASKLERELHTMFADARRKGEWFYLTAGDLRQAVSYIDEFVSNGKLDFPRLAEP